MLQSTTRFLVICIGEPLGVILANFGDAPCRIWHGARIAQAVVAPVVEVRFVQAEKFSATARGAGGFGSTGAE